MEESIRTPDQARKVSPPREAQVGLETDRNATQTRVLGTAAVEVWPRLTLKIGCFKKKRWIKEKLPNGDATREWWCVGFSVAGDGRRLAVEGQHGASAGRGGGGGGSGGGRCGGAGAGGGGVVSRFAQPFVVGAGQAGRRRRRRVGQRRRAVKVDGGVAVGRGQHQRRLSRHGDAATSHAADGASTPAATGAADAGARRRRRRGGRLRHRSVRRLGERRQRALRWQRVRRRAQRRRRRRVRAFVQVQQHVVDLLQRRRRRIARLHQSRLDLQQRPPPHKSLLATSQNY